MIRISIIYIIVPTFVGLTTLHIYTIFYISILSLAADCDLDLPEECD